MVKNGSSQKAPSTQPPPDQQIWVRIPARGHEPHTGLARGFIYQLLTRGKLKTASIKRPGTMRGIRLIWLPSLLEYIERHVEKGGAL